MTEPAPPPIHRLPPASVFWPELRRPIARLRVSAQALHERLRTCLPIADSLAHDRSLAERTDTTPYEHLAADTIAAVGQLIDVLDHLERPVTFVAPTVTARDDLEF